jgi:hypothetical protein
MSGGPDVLVAHMSVRRRCIDAPVEVDRFGLEK